MQRKNKPITACMVGASAVGKTSLMDAYINQRFRPDHKRTIGADFLTTSLTRDDEKFCFKIWDTEENDSAFTETGSSCMSSVFKFEESFDIYFACVDLTNYNSLHYLDAALNKLSREHRGNTEIVLVATKIDRSDKPCIAYKSLQDFIAKHNITHYIKTSAQTYDNGSVTALFEEALVRAIVRRTQAAIPATQTIDAAQQEKIASFFKLFDQAKQGWLAEHPEADEAQFVIKLNPAK
tara:strand:+ start:868 stop:1578 length:711 start_codon:yes stop_codon:yes gene_type:complete